MPELDAEELFHLGLNASQKGDNDKAIIYLKESARLQPKAETIYILGAEYAEIGMYQRATECIEQALAEKPDLHTARFQCGLLYMMLNQNEQAVNTWLPLAELDKEDPLYHFATGLTQLIYENAEQAKSSLEKGIALNTKNPALNNDMGKILNNLKNAPANETTVEAAPSSEADNVENIENAAHRQMLVKNYGKE